MLVTLADRRRIEEQVELKLSNPKPNAQFNLTTTRASHFFYLLLSLSPNGDIESRHADQIKCRQCNISGPNSECDDFLNIDTHMNGSNQYEPCTTLQAWNSQTVIGDMAGPSGGGNYGNATRGGSWSVPVCLNQPPPTTAAPVYRGQSNDRCRGCGEGGHVQARCPRGPPEQRERATTNFFGRRWRSRYDSIGLESLLDVTVPKAHLYGGSRTMPLLLIVNNNNNCLKHKPKHFSAEFARYTEKS